jgi:hypothetical protein
MPRMMSTEGAAVSLGAAAVSAIFTGRILSRWLYRRKPYQLAWSLGLGLYAVAAAMQFLAEAYSWTVLTYKVYYLVAALLVAVLGIGSALLLNRRVGIGFALYTAVVFAGFAIAVAGATVTESALSSAIPVAGNALPDNVRIFSPMFTIPGSVALIGIAVYSYWRTRLPFNLWIGVGGLIVAAGASLTRLDVSPWALYLGELLGIAVMFWGFLASQERTGTKAAAAAQVPT